MAIWDDVITERDKQVIAAAGYGQHQGFGNKPAVLVIDVNYNFVGDTPEPILESIKKHHNSCGEEGWQAVYKTQELLQAAREKGVPVYYSTGRPRQTLADAGRWATKNLRTGEEGEDEGNRIVEEIAPQPGDIVLQKDKPSVFFGTTLLSYLVQDNVDSLIVCGCTTSGCVRATVIDAFSLNYKVSVVEECTFDRAQTSHKINLFDMNAKYADVIPLSQAVAYLKKLEAREPVAVRAR